MPMRAGLERYRGIVLPGTWGRWVGVAALAVVVSVLEAVGAVLVYALVGLATDPAGAIELPIIGDLRRFAPDMADDDLVATTAITVAVFFAVRGVAALVQSYVQGRVANRTAVQLSTRLLRQYLSLPYSFHLRRNSAELIRNANDSVDEVLGSILVPAVRLVSEGAMILGLIVVLLVSAPLATLLAAFTLIPIVVVLLRTLHPRIGRLGEISQYEGGRSIQALQQSLHGFRDITVLGRQEFFLEVYRTSRERMARTRYLRSMLREVPRVVIETSVVALVAVFLVASTATGAGAGSSLPVVGMFGYAALRIMPALNKVVAGINNIRFGRAALDDIQEDLRLAVPPAIGGADTPLPFRDRIALEDVSFRYESSDAPTLEGIDLTILRGQSVGLVGSTGAGKSTMIDLLAGLSQPTTGRLTVDGVDLRGNERAWQANLGMVSQQVFLLDDTLRRNIAIGVDDAAIDDEQVRSVVALAQLEGFVAMLPDGLDTWVGEQGVRVSGGQRQRIAIARALYGDPAVLILDEGTSALDNVTEASLIDAIEHLRGDRTIILVAHRLSTVRRCDQIVVMDQGRIVDVGTYDDLERRSPEFRRMARVGDLV